MCWVLQAVLESRSGPGSSGVFSAPLSDSLSDVTPEALRWARPSPGVRVCGGLLRPLVSVRPVPPPGSVLLGTVPGGRVVPALSRAVSMASCRVGESQLLSDLHPDPAPMPCCVAYEMGGLAEVLPGALGC